MTPKTHAPGDKSSAAEHPQPAQPHRGLLASGTKKQLPETAHRRPARRWISYELAVEEPVHRRLAVAFDALAVAI